eukprot:2961278-Alexandrium_andersonii.AAC.1
MADLAPSLPRGTQRPGPPERRLRRARQPDSSSPSDSAWKVPGRSWVRAVRRWHICRLPVGDRKT